MIEGGRLCAVAFSLAPAKIGMPGAEGGRRQGGPDPLDTLLAKASDRGLFTSIRLIHLKADARKIY
jgi:hypothetical protein